MSFRAVFILLAVMSTLGTNVYIYYKLAELYEECIYIYAVV